MILHQPSVCPIYSMDTMPSFFQALSYRFRIHKLINLFPIVAADRNSAVLRDDFPIVQNRRIHIRENRLWHDDRVDPVINQVYADNRKKQFSKGVQNFLVPQGFIFCFLAEPAADILFDLASRHHLVYPPEIGPFQISDFPDQ